MTQFVKCFDFVPFFSNEIDGVKKSEDYKPFTFADNTDADAALCILNSSTFFYYFVAYGDCFHCGKEFIHTFPVGLSSVSKHDKARLRELGANLMLDLRKNSIRKIAQSRVTGRVEYDEFWPRYSKPIIDQIDHVFARHYGFNDEEIDFLVNYDIKYRLGTDAGTEE